MAATARLTAAVSALALAAVAGTAGLVAQLAQTRTIALRNIHTDETVTVEFKKNGRYVPEAMERINWVMRDWRKNEPTKMDPALVDLLWEMHAELGSKQPINIISAYRSRGTNEMLRNSVGGQASESRHITGQAADVQFPDVALKQMRYAAMVREKGGVGYYPTSATPFVHVDTDRVRAWPRLPRFELALLFPNGRTQHQPAEGGPITAEDVRTAQSRHQDVAVQVAAFHDLRKGPRPATALIASAGDLPRITTAPKTAPPPAPRVAAVTPPPPPAQVAAVVPPPPAPKLVTEPRLVDRPSRLAPRPSEEDRNKLAQLALLAAMPTLVAGPMPAQTPTPAAALPSLTGAPAAAPAARPADTVNPRLAFVSMPNLGGMASDAASGGWGNGFVAAPAWDEEHPEEISYRPFPIAPFMTATASPDDPALTTMVHPDVARTVELLDSAGSQPPMRLRPGQQVAQLIWSQQFRGEAVALEKLKDAPTAAPAGLADRRVKTAPQR